MTFRNLTLPYDVNVRWISAPRFSTRTVVTDNGQEYRTKEWTGTLGRAQLKYTTRKAADAIDKMFQICGGKAYSFRVRDPRKWKATAAEGKFVGSQAVLRITDGAYTLNKVITKLDSTVVLTGGGTVDPLTGLILTGAPTAWAGKFYLCMRFDVDELDQNGVDVRLEDGTLIVEYPDVPVVEVLGE